MKTPRNHLKDFFANSHVGLSDAQRYALDLWKQAEIPMHGVRGVDKKGKPTGVVCTDSRMRVYRAGDKEIILVAETEE